MVLGVTAIKDLIDDLVSPVRFVHILVKVFSTTAQQHVEHWRDSDIAGNVDKIQTLHYTLVMLGLAYIISESDQCIKKWVKVCTVSV